MDKVESDVKDKCPDIQWEDENSDVPKGNRNCGTLPKRYVFVTLLFIGMIEVFVTRVNLSVAIVAMANSTEMSAPSQDMNVVDCAELLPKLTNHTIHTATKQNVDEKSTFNWDIETQSIILGSFYYGYLVSQLPGSLIVERFGAKWSYGLTVLITSILTLLTPQAAVWGSGALVTVRVLEGLVQGTMFPSSSVLIARWIPITERSRSFTLVYVGTIMGHVVGMLASGMLADSNLLGGWPSIFYISGAFGVVWFFFWSVFIYDTPSAHPTISNAELQLILGSAVEPHEKSPKVPWKSILKSVPVWSLNLAMFGYLWGLYTLATEMPMYFSNVLHFDIKMNGLVSAMPYVLQSLVGLINSYVADKLLQGNFTNNAIRKFMNSVASFGSGACFLFLAFAGCRPILSVVLICAAMAFNGFVFSGCEVTVVDMSPTYTGAVTAIANMWGNAAGFLSPYIVGKLTSSGQTASNWRWVFISIAAIYFSTGTLFDLYGSAERQPWDCPNEEKKSKSESQSNQTAEGSVVLPNTMWNTKL